MRESRETVIDNSAAFDTESQIFLDEALGSAGVSFKLRRVIQALFRVASGAVRITNPDGTTEHSKPFNISNGLCKVTSFLLLRSLLDSGEYFHAMTNRTLGLL